jgi:SOS-response transcriptional repressor LexA|tara:strand:+ start:236 stop:631 length:396 start_codon:yes stop_codon:yes gene_type:complete
MTVAGKWAGMVPEDGNSELGTVSLPKVGMTPRQKECFDFISGFWDEKGYAPSYDEIAEALGAKSKASIAGLVSKLEERGFIRRVPHLARSIHLVADPPPLEPPQRESTPAPSADKRDAPLVDETEEAAPWD